MNVEALLEMTDEEMKEAVRAEVHKRIASSPVFRAEEEKHWRLLMHGTNGAGISIIPYTEQQ